MLAPVITINTAPDQAQAEYHFSYHIAGCLLLSDRPFPALAPFPIDIAKHPASITQQPNSSVEKPSSVPLFNNTAWLGNANRHLQCRSLADGYWLFINDIGTFTVRFSKQTTAIYCAINDISTSLLEELLLGPPMMLALAKQKHFCLHASAALINNRAYAFLGDSGKGKSTLADFLGDDHIRISDDILPLTIEENQIYIHSHFPQLKITPEQQPGVRLPEKLALSGVFVLDESKDKTANPTTEQQQGKRAFLPLVQQTVAVRLFNHELSAEHMAFFQQITESTTVHRLIYPRDLKRLNEVQMLLEDFAQ